MSQEQKVVKEFGSLNFSYTFAVVLVQTFKT